MRKNELVVQVFAASKNDVKPINTAVDVETGLKTKYLSTHFILNDQVSDFKALLCKNNDISCHLTNIQMLMIELYKIKNELAPAIMD